MSTVVAKGVDYSTGPPPAQAVVDAGLSFVCRYVSVPDAGKNISATELSDMDAQGVGVVLVFEGVGAGRATRALAGRDAGWTDAVSARAQADSVGFPASRPIYFAVDFDVTPGQYATVDAYLQGVADVLGAGSVGVYGSHRYVMHAFDGGLVSYGWAADAWGGQLDDRAHLVQRVGAFSVAGVPCDVDEALRPDYGQHNYQPQEDDMALTEQVGTRPDGTPFTAKDVLENLYMALFYGGSDVPVPVVKMLADIHWKETANLDLTDRPVEGVDDQFGHVLNLEAKVDKLAGTVAMIAAKILGESA